MGLTRPTTVEPTHQIRCWAFQVTHAHVQGGELPLWFRCVGQAARAGGMLLVGSANEDVWHQAHVGDWVVCVADALMVVSETSFRGNLPSGEPDVLDRQAATF